MTGVPEEATLLGLVEAARRKTPAYLDLVTARSDGEFDQAFDTILEAAVAGLERNCANFKALNEEGLSGALALALSIPGCLSVTQEAHSNGHVDLTIVADGITARRRLAEAKIWGGSQYHISGLAQLLDRYTTGREGRGLVIAYVKLKNISGLMSGLRETMNRDRPCKQTGDAIDHPMKWSFVTAHGHSCGEALEVGHIGCNLCTEPTAETET